MSDYPMLISNKLHSFRNFILQSYNKKDRIVDLSPPLQAIGNDESDQFSE